MKKLILLLSLCICLAFALCACGAKDKPAEDEGESEAPEVVQDNLAGEFSGMVDGVWLIETGDYADVCEFLIFSSSSLINAGWYPGEMEREGRITEAQKNEDGSYDLKLFYPATEASEMYDAMPEYSTTARASSSDGYKKALSFKFENTEEYKCRYIAGSLEEAASIFDSIMEDARAGSPESELREFAPNAIENVTKAMITYIGKEKTPILITDGGTCHADGYYHIFGFTGDSIEQLIACDWIEAINLDTGLVQACHMGGGYGETYSWYTLLDVTSKKGSISTIDKGSTSEFIDGNYLGSEDDEEMAETYYSFKAKYGDHYYMPGDREVSKNEYDTFIAKWRNGKNILTEEAIYKGLQPVNSKAFKG